MKIKLYRAEILSFVMYWCEILSLTLWEKHGLRVIENEMLRMIFEPKVDEVTREWRRLHYRSFMICTHHQIFW